MSATIVRNRIRLAIDNILNRGLIAVTDALTGRALTVQQAEDVQIELGIFSNGTIAADISNFTSITMELKDPEQLLAPPLFTLSALKTASVSPQVDLTQTVSLADWNAGIAQHATFVLTYVNTNIELQGRPQRFLTVFFWGNTATPQRIPLGKSELVLIDSGYGDLAAITVTPPGARMKNSKLQILSASDGLYYDLVGRTDGAGGQIGSLEGAGEA